MLKGMNTYISPTILSNAFGVSPSTLKRWSNKGILKSDRTRGGHRRFSISEAIKMSRDLGIPFRNPESIGLPEPIEPSGLIGGREPFEILHQALEAQDLAESQRIVLGLFLSGMPIVELLEDVVTPVIARLGMQWVKSPIGIANEHAATQMLLETLGTLKNLLPTAEGRVLAAGGAPSGDPYRIPTTMVSLIVQDLGHKSINLGPDLPSRHWLNTVVKRDRALRGCRQRPVTRSRCCSGRFTRWQKSFTPSGFFSPSVVARPANFHAGLCRT